MYIITADFNPPFSFIFLGGHIIGQEADLETARIKAQALSYTEHARYYQVDVRDADENLVARFKQGASQPVWG